MTDEIAEFDNIPFDVVAEKAVPASERSEVREHCEQGRVYSNTSSQITNDQSGSFLKLGGSAFDSLYLSHKGVLKDKAELELLKFQKLAQDPRTAHLAQIRTAGELFKVLPYGRKHRSFVLIGNLCEIELGNRSKKNKTVASVKVYSRWLLVNTPLEIEKEVTNTLGFFCDLDGCLFVTRADLKIDFCYPDHVIQGFQQSQFICRSGDLRPVYKKRILETWSAGSRKSIFMRLYNKTVQLASDIKHQEIADDLAKVWKSLGWNGENTVWRNEFELHRTQLKEFGVSTVDQLVKAQNGLWNHLTTAFLRIVIPNDTDQNASRWPNHPFWDDIHAAGLTSNDFVRLKRSRPNYNPKRDYTLERALGYIATAYALDGVGCSPVEYIRSPIISHLIDGEDNHGTPLLHKFDLKVKAVRHKLNIAENDQNLFPQHKSFKPEGDE